MALGSLVLGSPLGLWSLLAVPVLLLIHLLQRKAQLLPVSTLFLLERIAPEASEGRRFDRLRTSASLWLQLLAVVAVAWVLADPRFVETSSVQRAVVVLDSSASMSVFHDEMIREVERALTAIDRAAARTEWMVIDSDLARRTIYSGSDRPAALEAIRSFEATAGSHDFGPALAVARGLARGRGLVLLVTDHRMDVGKRSAERAEAGGTALPEDRTSESRPRRSQRPGDRVPLGGGVTLLAVGRPIENVGFTGLTVKRQGDATEWAATLVNHGVAPADRTLTVGGEEAKKLALAPGEVRTLRGLFPAGADQLRLVLSGDAFPLDDTIPMVRPRPKVLRVYVEPPVQEFEVVHRLLAGLEARQLIGDPARADLVIAGRRAGEADPPANAIVFSIDDAPEKSNEVEPALGEPGPLTEGLPWQGLLRAKTKPVALQDGTAVVWQGDRPLIWLRPERRLIVGFDPRHSNADHVPSFAVLLLRFVESLRAAKPELEAKNVETGQPLALAVSGTGQAERAASGASGGGRDGFAGPGPADQVSLRTEKSEQRFDPRAAALLAAPRAPGFFFVQQGDLMLLAGAARFGDLREADLSRAETDIPSLAAVHEIALRNSRADPLRPLWLLVAGVACVGAWLLAGQAKRAARTGRPNPGRGGASGRGSGASGGGRDGLAGGQDVRIPAAQEPAAGGPGPARRKR